MLTVRSFLLVAATALVLAWAVAYGAPFVGSDAASASDGGPEMRLAVKSGGECEAGTCTIPLGGSFTLAVEIVTIPDEGYILAQTSIFIGPDLVYHPAEVWSDELVSPDCVPPIRLAIRPPEGTLEHGCLTGLLPPLPVSTYIGNFIELKMTCSEGNSSTEVQLLPFVIGERTGGALFVLFDGSTVIPKTSNLTVECGDLDSPTNTPRPPTTVPPTPTQTPGGPEMRLIVKEGGTCDGDTCTVPSGASFTLAVEVVGFPAGGYVLAQTYIDMGTDLIYKPSATSGDEFVWPDCGRSVVLRSNVNETRWLHGCLTGVIPPLPPSTYTGNFIELKVNCSEGDSSTEVQLIPNGKPQLINGGTFFASPDGVWTVPKTSNITVVCGSAPGPTNTPPTSIPVPLGDANCDGIVDAKDASLVLQRDAGLLDALPCEDSADVNGDGLLNSLDAVLILQLTADLIHQLPAGDIQ